MSLDTAKVLTNVCNVNDFNVVTLGKLRASNATSMYFRLFQTDLVDRYIPASGATLVVKFLRSNTVAQTPVSQTVSASATNPFADDRSIWKIDLTSTQVDTIISGGVQFVLTEGANISTFFVKDLVQKVPIQGS